MSTTTMDTDDVLGQARTHALDQPTFFQRLVETHGIAPAIARLGLGLVMLPHAVQKAFALQTTYANFTKMGIPGPLAFLAIAAEIFGTVSLLTGFLTRLGAIAIAAVMLGAIFTVHVPKGDNIELHLLALTLCLVVLLKGGGLVSLDRFLMRRHPAREGGMNPTFANVTEG